MSESWSKVQKDISLYSNKHLSEMLPYSCWTQGKVTWGKMSKNLSHMKRHSQKTWNPKTIFHCKLEESPSLWIVWIALWTNQLASYGKANCYKISNSMRNFKVRYTHTPPPNMLSATNVKSSTYLDFKMDVLFSQ